MAGIAEMFIAVFEVGERGMARVRHRGLSVVSWWATWLGLAVALSAGGLVLAVWGCFAAMAPAVGTVGASFLSAAVAMVIATALTLLAKKVL